MNSSCPVCDRPIPAVASRCRCGWIRKEARAPVTEQFIDLTEHTLRAERWCNDRGLNTTEKKIGYCREVMKKLMQPRTVADYRRWMDNPKSELARQMAEEFKHRRPVIEREPGADFEEDERAAA